MRKIILHSISFLLFVSCNSKPSLEKYFVENTNNENFVQVDISPSILNIETNTLSTQQKKALQSFEKINILAFVINPQNKKGFETERQKVNQILKDQKYQQLMKFGLGKEGVSIYSIENEDKISEFILFGNKNDTGFGIARILGNDMNLNNIITIIDLLDNKNMNLQQIKPLFDKFGLNKKTK